MKAPIIPLKGAYYVNEFWFSDAYRTLPNKSRDLLQCFLTELRKRNIKVGRNKRWVNINNGEVSFSETSFRKLTNCAKETYRKGIYHLVERGIIEITYRGGSGRGDISKYRILCISDVLKYQQKWRNYPDKNWANDIRKIKNYSVGKKTRFPRN